MRLTQVAVACADAGCPTVYNTDRDTVVVQGYAVPSAEAGIDVPAGELLVEVPRSLLIDCAAALHR